MAFISATSLFGRTLSRRTGTLVSVGLLLLCVFVYGGLSQVLVSGSAGSLQQAGALQPVTKLSDITNTTTQASSTPPSAAAPTSVKVQQPAACTPSAYALPSNLSLSATPAGLKEVIEPTQTYAIHGTDGATIREQIQACAPRQHAGDSAAEYTAQTGYSMTWQYSYAQQADGSCVVTNPRIGLHVAMVLPAWSDSTASASFTSQWQTFLTNLTTHENGHVDLDRQYAREMLSDLQNFPASPCDTIQQSVNGIMQNSIARLNVANDQYDATTNHGATQGAVLPK